jgi:hypothetical protein
LAPQPACGVQLEFSGKKPDAGRASGWRSGHGRIGDRSVAVEQ